MADIDLKTLRDSAQRAKSQLDHLDLDFSSITDHLPKNLDWNIVRQREESAESRGFRGGFILGAITGAIIALIFAPRRGSETRELVTGAAVGAATDIKDKATGIVSQATSSDAPSAVVDHLADFRAKLEDRAGEVTDSVKDLASNLKETVTHESSSEDIDGAKQEIADVADDVAGNVSDAGSKITDKAKRATKETADKLGA